MSLNEYLEIRLNQATHVRVLRGNYQHEEIHVIAPELRERFIAVWTQQYYDSQLFLAAQQKARAVEQTAAFHRGRVRKHGK